MLDGKLTLLHVSRNCSSANMVHLIRQLGQCLYLGHCWPSTGANRPLPRKLRRKSEKGFPGPLGPGAGKARKRVKMTIFQVFWGVFGAFSTLFRPFSAPFGVFQGEAFLTLVEGQRCPKFIQPPPALKLLSAGGGHVKQRGGIKSLPQAPQNVYPPPPSILPLIVANNGGRGCTVALMQHLCTAQCGTTIPDCWVCS